MLNNKLPFSNVKWKMNDHSGILEAAKRLPFRALLKETKQTACRPAHEKLPTNKSWPPLRA